jgi:hypothetical protein
MHHFNCQVIKTWTYLTFAEWQVPAEPRKKMAILQYSWFTFPHAHAGQVTPKRPFSQNPSTTCDVHDFFKIHLQAAATIL